MNLVIDSKVLELFNDENLKVYFYNSGCEWTKVNLEPINDFNWYDNIKIENKNIYFLKEDEQYLDWWKIILQVKKDENWHWGKNKFLFVSQKITSRCWCSSSFSFEKKLIDSNKLNLLKKAFNK